MQATLSDTDLAEIVRCFRTPFISEAHLFWLLQARCAPGTA